MLFTSSLWGGGGGTSIRGRNGYSFRGGANIRGNKYSLTLGSCFVGPDISVVQTQDVF